MEDTTIQQVCKNPTTNKNVKAYGRGDADLSKAIVKPFNLN